ncbi:MAG: urease accessory protein UreD [Polyangiaceae bacterium]
MIPQQEMTSAAETGMDGELSAGEGVVEVAPGGRVVRCRAVSPLKVLLPKNHGHAAWLFVASFGGGLVNGDALRLRLKVGAGASAYVSTQASTKVYPGESSQRFEADVGEGGLLCALPDPVVCFAGASFRQSQRVRLAEDASLVWLDSVSAGRVEHGERWKLDRYESRTRVERGGRLWIEDAIRLDQAHGELAGRMRRFSALATLVAVGPRTLALRKHWLAAHGTERERGAPEVARDAQASVAHTPAGRARTGGDAGRAVLVAPSSLGEDGVVVRVAAERTRELLGALTSLLAPVAEMLGDDPLARKW